MMTKCLPNERGLVNAPTKLVLKNLVNTQKLSFCFLVKPRMNKDNLPSKFSRILAWRSLL